MNIRNTWLSLGVIAALVAAPAAQEQTAPPVTEAAIQELIGKLGDDSYQVRRDAETRLGEIGERAVETLQDAAENHADEEVRWRARRLVQRIERGDVQGLRLRGTQDPQPPGRIRFEGFRDNADLDRLFERVFGELERDFGLDIPRTRFFEEDFFKGLEEQMGDLRRGLEDRTRGRVFGPGWNFDSSSESVGVKIGPDGVRLEISKKDEAGETDTKVYEAPDMESFREQYPELAEQYMQGGGGLRAFTLEPFDRSGARSFLRLSPGIATPQRGTPRTLRLAPRGLVPVDPRGEVAEAPPPPEGKRLGVLVTDVPPDVSRYLGLDEGAGLLVEEVEDAGLAEALGIEAGDVLLEIGGEPISAVADVARALGAIEAGDTVEVTVNRRGRQVELRTQKRKSAEVPSLKDR